ncbi:MAG: hypothetical protein E6234_05990 [Sutterella wadsworthensis]|nr:hypothetical protein [Sutterella wadsworthensis]
MAEKFSFEYVTTATGEINGESFITQTEDAINDLGVRVYNFNENVKETKVLSREVLEQVSRTERVANNAAEMATKASQDVNTMQETFTQWGSLIGETNSNSSQSLTIAKNAKEESANALVVATEAKSLAQTAKADAESASIGASKSATKAEASEKLAREAKALAEESRKFAESAQKNAETAGVKTVRYVAQELTDDEKAMARVNIDAAQGDSEGVFVPTSEGADDSGVDGKLRFYTPDNVLQVHTGNEWKSLFQYSGALDLVTLGEKQIIREEKTFSKGIVATSIWGGSASEGGVESGNLYLNAPRGENATYGHKVYIGGTDEGAEAVRKDMLVGYATKTEIANTYLTKSAATSTYATKDFVNKEWGARTTQAEGAIKALQASAAAFPETYATKSEVSAVDSKFADYAKTASLNAYAKKTEVESTYATKAELKEVSANAGSGGDVDLSGYVSKEDLTTKLGDYAKTADVDSKLSGYATKADVKASVSQGKFIKANGNRGQIGGYSTQHVSSSTSDYPNPFVVTVESPDDLYVYAKARRTIKFVAGEEDQVATKVVHVQSHRTSGCAITWEGCVWASGSAPVFGNPSAVLIVVARFSAGKVYASVFQNSQG